ncbi:MAG: hypothetical protein ACKVX9_08410 [Blastocatellia bacterium]
MPKQLSIVCKIQHPISRLKSASLPALPVDGGSVYTWIPKATLEALGIMREKEITLVTEQGERITRGVGFAILCVDKYFTIDEVLFAERGDRPRLGLRSLQGLNLVVEPRQRQLKPAPPHSAAYARDDFAFGFF